MSKSIATGAVMEMSADIAKGVYENPKIVIEIICRNQIISFGISLLVFCFLDLTQSLLDGKQYSSTEEYKPQHLH